MVESYRIERGCRKVRVGWFKTQDVLDWVLIEFGQTTEHTCYGVDFGTYSKVVYRSDNFDDVKKEFEKFSKYNSGVYGD